MIKVGRKAAIYTKAARIFTMSWKNNVLVFWCARKYAGEEITMTINEAKKYLKSVGVKYDYEISYQSELSKHINLDVWFITPLKNVYTLDRGGNTMDYDVFMYDDNASQTDGANEKGIIRNGYFTKKFYDACKTVFLSIEEEEENK